MKKFESLLKYSKKLSVLYAEDHEELRNSTVEILSSFFTDVATAEDGLDALNTYKNYFLKENKYYDIVLTDIKMPNIDGVALIEKIYEINPQQKIIVISAHDESEYLLPLINLGIHQFIQKPIEFNKLLDVLENISKNIMNNDMIVKLSNTSFYNRSNKILTVDEKDVYLTKYEIIFMDYLSQEKGNIYKNEDIVNYYHSIEENIDPDNIRKLVSKLRKKLPNDSLESIYSVGYRLI